MPKFVNVCVDNAATDTTGVKASYTAPDGGAIVTGVFVFHGTGTIAIVDVRHTLAAGATPIILRRSTAVENFQLGVPVALQPGERVELFVSTAGAAGNSADLYIGAEAIHS